MVLEVESQATVIPDRVFSWCFEREMVPSLSMGKNPTEKSWNHEQGSGLEPWLSSKGEVSLRLRLTGTQFIIVAV